MPRENATTRPGGAEATPAPEGRGAPVESGVELNLPPAAQEQASSLNPESRSFLAGVFARYREAIGARGEEILGRESIWLDSKLAGYYQHRLEAKVAKRARLEAEAAAAGSSTEQIAQTLQGLQEFARERGIRLPDTLAQSAEHDQATHQRNHQERSAAIDRLAEDIRYFETARASYEEHRNETIGRIAGRWEAGISRNNEFRAVLETQIAHLDGAVAQAADLERATTEKLERFRADAGRLPKGELRQDIERLIGAAEHELGDIKRQAAATGQGRERYQQEILTLEKRNQKLQARADRIRGRPVPKEKSAASAAAGADAAKETPTPAPAAEAAEEKETLPLGEYLAEWNRLSMYRVAMEDDELDEAVDADAALGAIRDHLRQKLGRSMYRNIDHEIARLRNQF